MQIRFRIAPTPSGFLHEGNAFNFILTAARARIAGGSLRLRIDDLDAPRVRREYLEDIFETLRWLDICPDAGPADVVIHEAETAQRHRIPLYKTVLEGLVQTGLVFACTCSRAEILAQSPDGRYPGTCITRHIPLDLPDAAWRIRTTPEAVVSFREQGREDVKADVHRETPHFVIRRRDGLPAYHVASLADDLHYGITDIIRGEDLLQSTAAQIYLSDCLGGAAFDAVRFEHHALLRGEGGEKQSKSAGAASLRAMQERGVPVSEIYRRFSRWAGLPGIANDLAAAAALLSSKR